MSELGLVTPAGKVVWGKYAQVRVDVCGREEQQRGLVWCCQVSHGVTGALTLLQVTNNPENDGCINAVLLV